MSGNGSYGGVIGEAFKNHFHPRIFKYTVGLSIFLILFGMLGPMLAAKMASMFPGAAMQYVVMAAAALVFGMVLSRFYLAYKKSHRHVGLFNRVVPIFESYQFGLRYMLINIIIFVFITLFSAVATGGTFYHHDYFNNIFHVTYLEHLAEAPSYTAMLCIFLTPYISAVLTCYCHSVKDVFRLATWKKLWDHVGNLTLTYGAMLFTGLLFCTLYGIGMAMIFHLIAKLLPVGIVNIAAGVGTVMIASTNIILLSRFCAALTSKH